MFSCRSQRTQLLYLKCYCKQTDTYLTLCDEETKLRTVRTRLSVPSVNVGIEEGGKR
jgi:hypothetical protein